MERSDWWKQYVRIFHKKIYIQKMQRRQTSSNSILAVNAKTIEANWSSTCRPANNPVIQPSLQSRSWPVGTWRGRVVLSIPRNAPSGEDRGKKAAFVLRKCYYLWLPSQKKLSRKSSYFKRRCSVTVKNMHDKFSGSNLKRKAVFYIFSFDILRNRRVQRALKEHRTHVRVPLHSEQRQLHQLRRVKK